MKKFLIYVVVIVTCLFLGFTVYYLSLNDENIKLSISGEEAVYKNIGESYSLPITWTKPNKNTKLSVSIADQNVAEYDEETKKFNCIGGGFTTVTIETTNTTFGPFVFELYVGNGSKENPFIIRTASELASIGTNTTFTLGNDYLLIEDIDLLSYNQGVWSPLGEYSGRFNGNGHTLYNLNINGTGNAGLFSQITATGMVEDLKFTSAKIEGEFDNAGIVAGINKGTIGKIEVVSSKITNTSATGITGGIAGSNLFDSVNAVINACSVETTINALGYVGGIAGFNNSSLILNSKAIVKDYISSEASFFGGIVGKNQATYIPDNAETVNVNEQKYYPSAIKNSFAIIENTQATNAVLGGVVAQNNDPNFGGKLVYNEYIGAIYANPSQTISKGCGVGEMANDNTSDILTKTKEDLRAKDNYVGYNFDSVWTLDDYAKLNFDSSYENYKIKAIGTVVDDSTMTLAEFLNSVRSDRTVTAEYVIKNNGELDLAGAQWQTIAPESNNPMMASITVQEGVTFTVKNFVLSENNSSFFGYISGNNAINGLTFENVTVRSSSANSSASVVATALLNNASLENIKVNGKIDVDTTASTFGVLCADNNGSIVNCNVDLSQDSNIKAYGSDKLAHIGGLVGNNLGYIDSCKLKNINIHIENTGNFHIGGLVGATNNSIINSNVENIVFITNNKSSIYASGLVGYASANTYTIDKCYAIGSVEVDTGNTKGYVAGLVGYLSKGVTLKNSFFGTKEDNNKGSLKGYHVGGLVGVNYGDVKTSYVDESAIKGVYIGGLSFKSYGTITNAYTLAHLEGLTGDSFVCGLTYKIISGKFQYCFSNATFSGKGEYYLETKSEFRVSDTIQTITQVAGNNLCGDIKNSITIKKPKTMVQRTEVGFSTWFNGKYPGYIKTTEEECNGTTGNYSVFKEKAGFDYQNIWSFNSEVNNGFPTLKDVVVR